jgi:hypothetical protein
MRSRQFSKHTKDTSWKIRIPKLVRALRDLSSERPIFGLLAITLKFAGS